MLTAWRKNAAAFAIVPASIRPPVPWPEPSASGVTCAASHGLHAIAIDALLLIPLMAVFALRMISMAQKGAPRPAQAG